jgi:tol-pal system protein YbgF
MSKLPRLAVFAVCVVSATFGPVRPLAAADKEHLQMMADIRMLQEQAQQLQQMLGTLAEALKMMTAKMDEQGNVTRKAFADQKLVVDNASTDLRVVREKLDETNVRITSLSQELEAVRQAIPPMTSMAPAFDPTLAPGEGAAMAGGIPPSMPSPAPPAGAIVPPGTSPQRLYDMAWADYAAGQWTLAIQGFQSFMRAFPKSELADDAQYLIGESYLLDNKFRDALDGYEQVIKNYPGGDKLPNAYYKRGVVLERLGQSDRARESYEFVVKNYPETPAGALAKQRLNRPGN